MKKLIKSKTFWGFTTALILGGSIFATQFNPATLIDAQVKRNDNIISEQMAYHVGTLAYLYGYPLVDMKKQMHNETHRVSPDQQVYAPLNRMYYFEELVGPDNAGNLRLPNNDTLYFSGWFDISQEPLIVHTPDTNDRYFTIAVTNLYSEVTHIGRRTHGTEEAYYALVTPDWQGTLPANVTPVEVETPTGWMLGRLLVDGPKDFDSALTDMKGIWSVPLSEFTPGQPPQDIPEKTAKYSDPMKSMEYFEIMNRALKTLPPRASEAALMAQFDTIGLGPNSNFNPDQLDDATRRGLKKALEDGYDLVQASMVRTIPSYNGWMSPDKIGRYGFDYIQRSAVVGNGYGNLPEEATYAAATTDAEGHLMSGSKVYKLHFKENEIPPVNAFWSLIAYSLPEQQVQKNAIERYSIGDRTKGLNYNDDGSLTLWLQSEAPSDPDKNWLPTPDGFFMTVIRMYDPKPEILDKTYRLPRIEVIN